MTKTTKTSRRKASKSPKTATKSKSPKTATKSKSPKTARNQGVQTNNVNKPITAVQMHNMLKEFVSDMSKRKKSINTTNKSLTMDIEVTAKGKKTNDENAYKDYAIVPYNKGKSKSRTPIRKAIKRICLGALGATKKIAGTVVEKQIKCVYGTVKWFYKTGVNVCINNMLDNVQYTIPPSITGRGVINLGLCLGLIGGVWGITYGKITFVEDGVLSTYLVKPTSVIFGTLIGALQKYSAMSGLTGLVTSLITKGVTLIKDSIGITKLMEMISTITATVGEGLVEAKNIIVNVGKQAGSAVKTAVIQSGAINYILPFAKTALGSVLYAGGAGVAMLKKGYTTQTAIQNGIIYNAVQGPIPALQGPMPNCVINGSLVNNNACRINGI